jgi:hypothetical protein
MYSAQTAGLGVTDGGTINPAALNSGRPQSQTRLSLAGVIPQFHNSTPPTARRAFCPCSFDLSTAAVISADMEEAGALTNPIITPETSPRGIKRSRSPDTYGDLPLGDGLGDDGTWPLAEIWHSQFTGLDAPVPMCYSARVPILDTLLIMSYSR